MRGSEQTFSSYSQEIQYNNYLHLHHVRYYKYNIQVGEYK